MKKTIIILILVVYVSSVALVNFFGLEVKVHDGIVYVTSIQCKSITLRNDQYQEIAPSGYYDDGPVFMFDFIGDSYAENDTSNPNVVQLNLDVLPHNADTSSFIYIVDDPQGCVVFKKDINAFVFILPGTIGVTVRASDGSNKQIEVLIAAL